MRLLLRATDRIFYRSISVKRSRQLYRGRLVLSGSGSRETSDAVELSPSLREGREVTSGEGRRQASDDSKRTMTKKSPIPFTTNLARSLLAERLQTNWVFRMSSRNVKRQELVSEVSRQRKSNTGLAAALPSLSLDPPGGRVKNDV